MNHYVSLSLTNRKSSVHLHALYSPHTALRTFTPRRDQLVICGQYVMDEHTVFIFSSERLYLSASLHRITTLNIVKLYTNFFSDILRISWQKIITSQILRRTRKVRMKKMARNNRVTLLAVLLNLGLPLRYQEFYVSWIYESAVKWHLLRRKKYEQLSNRHLVRTSSVHSDQKWNNNSVRNWKQRETVQDSDCSGAQRNCNCNSTIFL
jgi:hypothetical protein